MSTTLRPARARPAKAPGTRKSPDDGARLTLVNSDLAPVTVASDRAVMRWLVACITAVSLAVAVGGITRLTESGLSITEWKPVSGVLPPLTAAEWHEAYARYLAIPEAQTVHLGITLDAFQKLFWWEWTHRMLARTVGLVLAVPFFVLLLRRQIRPGMRLRLMNLPLLAALQGGMGWYMVQSGLSGRTSVSPYRLVAHLAVALVIFAIAVWTASELRRPTGQQNSSGGERAASPAPVLAAPVLAAFAFLAMLSGGFVAGLDAGHVFNTFPLMEGRLIPVGYDAISGWRNAFENPIAAQLHHRGLAFLTAMMVWFTCSLAYARSWPVDVRRGLLIASLVAAFQVTLGIATLLLSVPIPVAVLHQVTALALFAVLLTVAQRGFNIRSSQA
jgi:cytochrome c oxidase assembly protein subunit 15